MFYSANQHLRECEGERDEQGCAVPAIVFALRALVINREGSIVLLAASQQRALEKHHRQLGTLTGNGRSGHTTEALEALTAIASSITRAQGRTYGVHGGESTPGSTCAVQTVLRCDSTGRAFTCQV